MFELIIPKGVYHRANGNLPPFELINMFAESTPSAKGGVSLLSFPGLTTSVSRGTGPINAIFRRSDLFGGDVFAVSDSTFFRGATSFGGTLAGTGTVSIAASDVEVVVTRGSTAKSYNGTNFQNISFPDGASVTAVTFLAGLFVYARANSHKFYWSAVLDGRTIDALDFASAESSPDWLLDVFAIGDNLILAGKDSIEFWYPTGDGTLPFLRITQRTTAVGVKATGCMAALDNALHFVGSDNIVYRMAEVPTRISNHGLEEEIANSTTCKVFPYRFQGHSFLNVRLDSKTYGYDAATSQWHERQTWGVDNWAAQCACQQADGSPLFGSATGPELLIYSGWADGTSPLVREFTGAIPLTRSQPIHSVELECNSGETDDLTITNPQVEMRFSRDRGATWSAARASSLGATGQRRKRAKWRRNGIFDAPGALFSFRCTDPVPFRVSGSIGDESSAGRSR